MKVKVINRSLDQHVAASKSSPAPVHRNIDEKLHPMARAREYKRAVNAAKLERMHAKPFIGSLEGHDDGVYTLAKDEGGALSRAASGAGDGQVRVWNVSDRSCVWSSINGHRGMVTGLTFTDPFHEQASTSQSEVYDSTETRGSKRLLSCGTDQTVKLWDVTGLSGENVEPVQTYMARSSLHGITHHRKEHVFATAGNTVEIWDETRSSPLTSLSFTPSAAFNGDHITAVTFNKSEQTVLASSASDRSLSFYDLRTNKALHRVVHNMRMNDLVFNPLQPAILLCASEDHNLYTYDMRYLKSTTQVFKGHVNAVMSCDWSPTGRELVSGGYDKVIHLWNSNQGKPRDTYHTKRMQRVFAVTYTMDTRFILSGSDEANIRIWKARASEKLGPIHRREKAQMEYRDELRSKWGHVSEVAKIERQRYLPKAIYNAQRIEREAEDASKRREENRRKHAPRGAPKDKRKPERQRAIVRVDD